ncbi:hypothetical protein [Devosia rhizoryzae]|uniref:DUF4352 domain-containing protein n=1 Tax=Devosia rhizoryzae TaxID=2774137 RepID=A0ABX7C7B7_9HYPH|nr:hypothetical protein [Devosia rhizoryzae]QQR40155.1 hypothetical protein JI748_03840 [Devosia rhizoryzae]
MFKILSTLSILTLATAGTVQAQEFVAAGTELSAGQEATVPFLIPNGPEVPIALTITEIEPGDIADLGNFEIPSGYKDARPYYVRFTYTNEGDEDLSNYQVAGFVAFDADGTELMPSMTMGGSEPFTACQNTAPAELANGQSHEGCVLFLVPAEGELASVGYRGNYRFEEGKDTEADFPIYYDPVLWTAGETSTKTKGTVVAPAN